MHPDPEIPPRNPTIPKSGPTTTSRRYYLNSAGNKLVYDAIKATLEALYQEILPKDKHQPMIFMHQSKIDPFNYESTILP